MNKKSKIYIAGHSGMVGSACKKLFAKKGYKNLCYEGSDKLNLTNQLQVDNFFKLNKPEIVIICAAKVGGILANKTFPYDFIIDNLLIQSNIVKASFENNVKKLVFLGSSCIYPKFSKQPIKEEYLLSGPLEPTNESYAVAKISGLMLINALRAQHKVDYISLMPTNLYGPNDNFDLVNSHVIPALIRKFHDAKTNNHSAVTLWGSGKPMREFLHVDDLALAVYFVLKKNLGEEIYNVGSGQDISIKDLSKKIKKIVGFEGKVNWDKSKPDGTPRKLLDISKLKNLGWNQKIGLDQGLTNTYTWYKKKYN